MLKNIESDKILLLIFIILLETYLLYQFFYNNLVLAKITILFIIFILIQLPYFNNTLVFINNIYVIFIIIYFYNQINERNKNKNMENFVSRLKLLTQKSSNENNNLNYNFNFKKKNKKKSKKNDNNQGKEEFKDIFESTNKKESFEEYKKSFDTYIYNKQIYSSIDAFNKLPFYYKQFKKIFN